MPVFEDVWTSCCVSNTVSVFQVERILSAEQRATDFKPAEHGHSSDHQTTSACTKWVAFPSAL